MKFLRDLQDKQRPLFEKGGKLEKLYPLFEANDTFLFTPGEVAKGPAHVRDAIDLKRMMITVVVALLPCILCAIYNTGWQANNMIQQLGPDYDPTGWRASILEIIGLGFSTTSILSCVLHGFLYYFPVLLVTFIVGGNCEMIFSVVRKHEINEGFLVTGMLFPLIVPPAIPLWQVALGIAFGVIIGKEVFGGTGMNILNPALTARAFLFFAYPAQISGDKVWVAGDATVDGFSGATVLGDIANLSGSGTVTAETWRSAIQAADVSWLDAFIGSIPGSMGETSALACLFGACILLITKVGSWRTMIGAVVGSFLMVLVMNLANSDSNALMHVPWSWHMVLGGWAFGLVFMATDPVSGPYTERGRFIYGFFIGVFAMLIRVINPAYPEGIMLAILFMNVFSPLIDHVFINANINRRLERNAV